MHSKDSDVGKYVDGEDSDFGGEIEDDSTEGRDPNV
jgi:hypothetical protein